MLFPLLVAVGMGFVVALSTGFVLGKEKARPLLGGSFAAGWTVAVAFHLQGWLAYAGCAVAGVLGWLLWLILITQLANRTSKSSHPSYRSLTRNSRSLRRSSMPLVSTCDTCGAELPDEARHCINCGAPVAYTGATRHL